MDIFSSSWILEKNNYFILRCCYWICKLLIIPNQKFIHTSHLWYHKISTCVFFHDYHKSSNDSQSVNWDSGTTYYTRTQYLLSLIWITMAILVSWQMCEILLIFFISIFPCNILWSLLQTSLWPPPNYPTSWYYN